MRVTLHLRCSSARDRSWKKRNSPFEVALAATRAGNLFTTHTPVAAGFDRFSPALMHLYMNWYATEGLHISFDDLMALGRANPGDPNEPFNMAYLAARGIWRDQWREQAAGRGEPINIPAAVSPMASRGNSDRKRDQRGSYAELGFRAFRSFLVGGLREEIAGWAPMKAWATTSEPYLMTCIVEAANRQSPGTGSFRAP